MIGRVIARGLLAVAVVLAAAVDAGRDHSLPPARRRASSKARPSPAAPRIERDYRTMRPRLLVGHSLGDGCAKLHTVLRTHAAAAGLRWRAEVTPGAVHETNVARATPSALRAYFAGLASPKR